VGQGGDLDHLPILLQIEADNWKPPARFKFNHSWLDEEEFKGIALRNWKHVDINLDDTKPRSSLLII
jgi:hypothetical protein